jgi:hypothetical protein
MFKYPWLAWLPDKFLADGPPVIEMVRDAQVNCVYKLTCAQGCFAVKLLGDTAFNGVSYEQVFKLQKYLADIHWAPHPEYFDGGRGLWIEVWCGDPVLPLPTPETLGQVLAHLHQLSPPSKLPSLDIGARWQHYLSFCCEQKNQPLVDETNKLTGQLSGLQKNEDFCLCHNDLSLAHCLGQRQNILIDWEYAALGSRYFDLAACILINQFSPRQQQELIAAYAQHAQLDTLLVWLRVKHYSSIVAHTNKLWELALLGYQNRGN